MAHFAQLNIDNIVQQVIVIDDSCASTEEIGQEFIASLGLAGKWKQTSYNTYREIVPIYDKNDSTLVVRVESGVSRHRNGGTPFRGQYAAIGDFYDSDIDEFVSPAGE